jgi:hypothetical protein
VKRQSVEQGATNDNLSIFIEAERRLFELLETSIDWDSPAWSIGSWLFHRGGSQVLNFRPKTEGLTADALGSRLPREFSTEYADFSKSLVSYLHRTRGVGYASVAAYLGDLRRLYVYLFASGSSDPRNLTRCHFERMVNFLGVAGRVGLYDSAARLQAIADVMDKKQLTHQPLDFRHGLRPSSSRHTYVAPTQPFDENARKEAEKLPSMEALNAYALCTNQPINDAEEILLRTIDLLVAMGQRGNEVACIPLDCWVERPTKNAAGDLVTDSTGASVAEVGIRYFAEKQFQSRIHWLADQDVPLAERAVKRLQKLTKEAREVAQWQESHPGRLWSFESDRILTDIDVLKYLGFAETRNLHLNLSRNGVVPVRTEGQSYARNYYRAGDIEELLFPQVGDHVVLKEKRDGKWVTVLRTSETLSIRFDGAFRFRRKANTYRVLPKRTTIYDINTALGAIPGQQSIFDRRDLTEADGSRIQLTSHHPRHWRNTLYALAGMTNVQQALALGRQRLDQNPTYQHTAPMEDTAAHHQFLAFSTLQQKMAFVHSEIRGGRIVGPITEMYKQLSDSKGIEAAEQFLTTHAQAMHITPYGGCAHDFSQAPCPKHLQCWNGCGHLHRTARSGEEEQLRQLIAQSEAALERMKQAGDNEFGADVWTANLAEKIANMKRALDMNVGSVPVTVFPKGFKIKGAGSSVSEN